jgi:hypothetical protein
MREYWSLDLETTGIDRHGKSVPIQVGVAGPFGFAESHDIGGWDWDVYDWDAGAEAVHGITQAFVDSLTTDAAEVDRRLAEAIERASDVDVGDRILVGKQVGSFDVIIGELFLPKTVAQFDYHTVDLTALMLYLGEVSGAGYREWKNGLGLAEQSHDGLADALQQLEAWETLLDYGRRWLQGT